MIRRQPDAQLERFILGAAIFVAMLLAGLVIGNASNEKCAGGWHLLEIPCHTADDDYAH